jgi:hypothetical protein
MGIGAGALVAVFAVAAVAMAASRSYTGKVDPGGTVSFTARIHDHRAVRVKDFVFSGVGAMCDQGPTPADITANPLPPMHVNARHRFHGAFQISGTDETVRVRGVFKHRGRRARGRLRLTGSFGSATNCDTGVRRWRAHRS